MATIDVGNRQHSMGEPRPNQPQIHGTLGQVFAEQRRSKPLVAANERESARIQKSGTKESDKNLREQRKS
jgi:hypothetical protein